LISPFLEYVADKEEWAVKGYFDPTQTEAWLLRSDPTLIERGKQLSDAPGRRYFQEKRLRADLRNQTRLWTGDVAQRLQKTLTAWALSVQPLRVPSSAAGEREMFLNNSLLVARDRVDHLCAAVTRLNTQHAERGVTMELSGPWPPYSFSPSLA
jgi:hypothetical protein